MHEHTDRPHAQRERRSGGENTYGEEERNKEEQAGVFEEAPRFGREGPLTRLQSPARIGPPSSCICAEAAGVSFQSARFRKIAISCSIRRRW